jgi:hypothetical protein
MEKDSWSSKSAARVKNIFAFIIIIRSCCGGGERGGGGGGYGGEGHVKVGVREARL